MGINFSNLKIGGSNNHEIKENIKEILDFLLKQHMEQFLDKSFCKKTKLFLKNKVFMKQAHDDIKGLSGEVFIGQEISDLENKEKICSKLADFYLKKVNLVSSIYYITEFVQDKIFKLENGPICIYNEKQDITNIPYKNNFESGVLDFEKNKSLKIPENLQIKFNEKDIRKKAIDKFHTFLSKQGKTNHLSEQIISDLLYTELNTRDKCLDNGGKWVEELDAMIEQNLIPDNNLKSVNNKVYNKSFYNNILKLKNFTNIKITELIQILSKVIGEKIVGDKTEKRKIYVDQEITSNELDVFIFKVKKIIEDILIEIMSINFIIYNNNYMTKEEILNKEKLENKQKG